MTQPTDPTVRQVSGTDPDGAHILSVLAKRTYRIEPSGRTVLADRQVPLVEDGVFAEHDAELLLHDSDLYTFKPLTDVIVTGRAHAPGRASRFEASVRIGTAEKRVLVIGDRRAKLSPTGAVVFSDPAEIESIPLGYERAYGGNDAAAEEKEGNPFTELASLWKDVEGAQELLGVPSFAYPRNPCGRGFLIEPDPGALERLALPNLEDPRDPLTPERLCVGSMGRWPRQPLPQSFGWFGLMWFPRCAWFGMLPEHDPLDAPFEEASRGLSPAELLRAPREQVSPLSANGASPGLALPYLRGDETVRLEHLYPQRASFEIRLPGERPTMRADGRKGKMLDTEPVIHTILIEPEENRLSIVWRGSAPALRPYRAEELARMPFEVTW